MNDSISSLILKPWNPSNFSNHLTPINPIKPQTILEAHVMKHGNQAMAEVMWLLHKKSEDGKIQGYTMLSNPKPSRHINLTLML